jgi:hypothetical protein
VDVALIASAHEQIDLAAYDLTDWPVIDALVEVCLIGSGKSAAAVARWLRNKISVPIPVRNGFSLSAHGVRQGQVALADWFEVGQTIVARDVRQVVIGQPGTGDLEEAAFRDTADIPNAGGSVLGGSDDARSVRGEGGIFRVSLNLCG